MGERRGGDFEDVIRRNGPASHEGLPARETVEAAGVPVARDEHHAARATCTDEPDEPVNFGWDQPPPPAAREHTAQTRLE